MIVKMTRKITSSDLMFSLALVVITGVGTALLVIVSQQTKPIALNSNFIPSKSSIEEEPSTTAALGETDTKVTPAEEPAPKQPEQPQSKPTTGQNSTIYCSDCTFAAVDKQNSLPSTYTPNVVSTGLNGGGQLTPNAKNALVSLFQSAEANGLKMEIISSYRSYQTQSDTFNYWVSTELANGLSQADAEAEANTYSARAGESEHQLGTTVDLKCRGCESFNATQNEAVYKFIEDNAHKYGFVISYPESQDALTGYVYEPWHIRWIGVQLATELYETGYVNGNGNHLAKFLRDKGLSE